MSEKSIPESMKLHHEKVFATYGATPRGLDWSERETDLILRYDKMLDLVQNGQKLNRTPRLLDVGCGYGGLLEHIRARNLDIDYSGIDICEPMIVEAKRRLPGVTFFCGDILEAKDIGTYDYLVCNGIMTQKLDASIPQMNAFVRSLVRRMYELSSEGVAFNLMSSRVNFMVGNLFYCSPVEILSWCMTELSPNVALNHAYPLYEFTTYVYKTGLSR